MHSPYLKIRAWVSNQPGLCARYDVVTARDIPITDHARSAHTVGFVTEFGGRPGEVLSKHVRLKFDNGVTWVIDAWNGKYRGWQYGNGAPKTVTGKPVTVEGAAKIRDAIAESLRSE